ncbi:uncharacterized protein [Dermacentor albipictus]|uniref:uncharacterized protein isoform X1 n=1 Tax=Dermacentor albipictus TaxID=60249 RepID=UPI0031FC92CE
MTTWSSSSETSLYSAQACRKSLPRRTRSRASGRSRKSHVSSATVPRLVISVAVSCISFHSASPTEIGEVIEKMKQVFESSDLEDERGSRCGTSVCEQRVHAVRYRLQPVVTAAFPAFDTGASPPNRGWCSSSPTSCFCMVTNYKF